MAVRLTKRLQAAADAVRPNTRVADVGCDHGRLGAYLIQSGQCAFVTAVDINKKPLQKAAELFDKCGITDRTAVLQADGLQSLGPNGADDVVIAGLGADVMAGIIGRAVWLKDPDKRLVLVPSSRHARLRTWLCENGFDLVAERPVSENGHCYTVMTARYTGRTWTPGPVFAAIGIMKPGGEDYDAYLDRTYRSAQKIIAGLQDGEKLETAKQVAQHIERIRRSNG